MFLKTRNRYYLKMLRRSSHRPVRELLYAYKSYSVCTLVRSEDSFMACAGAMDKNMDLAVGKAISEYIERLVNWTNPEAFSGFSPHYRESTGMAAYPRLSYGTVAKARRHALEDATERFCFQEFQLSDEVGWSLEAYDDDPALMGVPENEIFKIIYLFPKVRSSLKFCICVGYLGDNGIVPGTACDTSKAKVSEQAFSEMIRQYIIAKNVLAGHLPEEGNYLRKLMKDVRGGRQNFERRIAHNALGAIRLPKLEFDQEVDHGFQSDYVVYRAMYKGQRSVFSDLI